MSVAVGLCLISNFRASISTACSSIIYFNWAISTSFLGSCR